MNWICIFLNFFQLKVQRKALEHRNLELQVILNDPELLSLFKAFSTKDLTVENLLFWEACVEYEKLFECQDSKLPQEKAWAMFAQFFEEKSPVRYPLSR